MNPPVRPRFGLIAGIVFLICADLLISLAEAQHMVRRYDAATGAYDMSQLDFTRLWYVGRRLTIALAGALHLPLPPPPGPAVDFPYDTLSTAAFPLQAWLYPPPVNLLAMLLSCLPLAVSYLVWNVASLVAAAALLRLAGLSWPTVAFGVAGPVTIFNIYEGQFGLIVGALLVAALLLADRRPRLAGALAGLLWLKPHLALALPAIVLPSRRAMIAAGLLSAGLFAGLALLFEGGAIWLWFVTTSMPIARQIISGPFLDSLAESAFSVFWCARSFGLAVPAAWHVQLLATACGFAAVAVAWHVGDAAPRRRMAFTLCVGTLMTPYGFAFDLAGYVMAMAVMLTASRGARRVAFGLLWLAPGLTMASYHETGRVLFPFVAILGCAMCHPFPRRVAAQDAG
jgi:hypothetical protein